MPTNLENSSGHRTGKCQFSFQSLTKANCTHLTHQQSNAQNSPSQALRIHELPDVQAGFRKGRGTRDQIVNIHWIMEKARKFHKNIYFCFIDYTKAFNCVGHNKLKKPFFSFLKNQNLFVFLFCFVFCFTILYWCCHTST